MIKKRTVSVPDGTISFGRIKRGGTPLVFLHGRMENGLCWSRVAERVEGNYDIYMPDIRGHGHTRLAEKEVDINVLVDDFGQFLERVGIKKVILAGHSMGAGIAALYIARKPENVKAVILSDPPWLYKKDYVDGDKGLVKKMENVIKNNKAISSGTLSSFIHFTNPKWNEKDCELLARAWKETNELVAFSYNTPLSYKEWEEKMQDVHCPALLLSANYRRGGILTPKSIREIKRMVPRIKHIHFSEAGHSIARDCFTKFVETINSFLMKL